jgi:transposase
MVNKGRNLNELNREQLLELAELLLARVATLEKQVAQLKQGDEKAVKKTPENSSLPPSQGQKANVAKPEPAKRGAKVGHKGTSRQRMAADEVIDCRVGPCPSCGWDLTDCAQWVVGHHQVIDLPPLRPIVREVRRYRVTCPNCQQQQTAAPAVGFEKGRMFGSHLEELVLYLHYAHPLSYERVQSILSDLCGLKISRGALVNGVKRAENHLKRAAEAIHRQIKQETVVGSDETTARVAGVKYWQWVFQTPQLAYHVIRPSRSAQVVREVMDGAQPAVWVSDVLSSQMCHPASDYQICLAHQVRDLQYAVDTHQCSWARQVQNLFYEAMRLHRQRDDLDAVTFKRRRQSYNTQLDQLLARSPANLESETLRHRFVKHRRALLLFLDRDDVPPTNNASEQALRNSVIYRKVTGGFRADWGADLYADLVSILETARRQGRPIFETLAAILHGQPIFDAPHSL